ncbi:MAG TPA: glucose 1-dehydrogenase [Kofleriaceae bacterium]|nr:glucose 1-dehydrogenase [Kofleriaceae bacterium]
MLLRPIEVGICGTDREIFAFEHGAPPPDSSELVLGHEALAEIVEVGPDVTWAHTGSLVVPMVRRPCPDPRCAACRAGRPEYCVTGEFSERGIVHADGFLTEYVLEDERYLVPVPRVLQDVAVLVEPLSVVAKAAEEFAAIHARFGFDIPRPRALVLGAGPIGLLAAMTFRADDYDTYVFSREAEDSPRAELIRSLQATYISAAHTPVERLPERIGAVDDMLEAVGVAEVAFGALPTLAANGVIVMTGIPAARDPVPADLSRWMRDLVLKNQVLLGTVNASRSAFASAVHRLEQFMVLFPDAVRSLITRSPFEQAPDLLARGRGIKDVIVIGRGGS